MIKHAQQLGYRALTSANIASTRTWHLIPEELREEILVVSKVLPFRTNEYLLEELIDWSRIPEDPIFQLTFPQREMLEPADYATVRDRLRGNADRGDVASVVNRIRLTMNPQPDGQREYNIPTLDGLALPGLQRKYRETVLFFPGQGQTCHAYCTYCFRWAQFINIPELRFSSLETDSLVAYLRRHPEVTDLLITGGDPMIMSSDLLARYLRPVLTPELAHVQNIRIGTKAIAFWPQRFVTDRDADDVLHLFHEVVQTGRHLALMAHFSHPQEISTPIAQEAVRRIRGSGAEIRIQGPLIRRVNDQSEVWRDLCQKGVRLGMIPYYMFVERDTGPKSYFEVPLVRAHEIFVGAFQQVSGLARTLRGPVMSTTPGKVRVLGPCQIHGRKVLGLEFLQARTPERVGYPFFAEMNEQATWFDQLRPAFPEDAPWFELGCCQPPL